MTSDSELLDLLFEALNADNAKGEKLGVLVREAEGNAVTLRQKLYVLRRQHTELACIKINQSPTDPEHELFLIRSDDNGS